MKSYFTRLKLPLVIFLCIQTLLRISLLAREVMEAEITALETVQILARGLWFDIVTASFVLLPFALLYCFAPQRIWKKRSGAIVQHSFLFILLFSLLFGFVAEHLFWNEFSTRFNFIAIDYLIYTQEVIGNIVESYPVGWLISAIALIALIVTWRAPRLTPAPALLLRHRCAYLAVYLALCGGLYSASNIQQANFDDNAIAGELAANGVYNLFYAFGHNEIHYERFYAEEPKQTVNAEIRELLEEPESPFESKDGITRIVNPPGQEHRKNVILVVMESMSADYMQSFGNDKNLTPNLDALASESLFFTQAYATGTRTVRGLEAVTLSVPPTPGQSIVRRPDNENLFSLGFIFKDRGYDTKFIYGGYGYFDNMNNFFAGNGFDIVDRTTLSKDEIHFANVWGVADDDMFARAIHEADKSYASDKPFMHLIMTTSNHRPYTYPEGKIDISPKSGRSGGVKYADYSVGKLIEWAKEKPWFNDTVFVFVADHTAGAGGKAELDPKKYHIPMMIYAPGFIKPERFEKIASQIDLGPILLGQLNFKYRTKFYGEDLIHDLDEVPHAFISNYQKVALVKQDRITVLAPKRKISQLSWPQEEAESKEDKELVEEAIAYYQSASWWKTAYRREPTVLQ